MLFFDPIYLIMVALPAMLLSGAAQWYLRSKYSKWSNIANSRGVSGPEAARNIMRDAGLNVDLEATPNELGDHYDPSSKTVRMSPSVANTNSVAAMAIVAHELGHAQQDKESSPLIVARNFLVPAAQFSPTVSYGMIIAGLLFNATGLAWLGVGVFGLAVLFMLLTLPVEIDASRRGLKLLESSGLLMDVEDRDGARQVLTAAALTYVAAVVTSVLQLLYFASLVSRND